MTLSEMYQEERETRGVRASIAAVATRTGKEPQDVAAALGFDWHLLYQGATPASFSDESGGGCDACFSVMKRLQVAQLGRLRLALCASCGFKLRELLPK